MEMNSDAINERIGSYFGGKHGFDFIRVDILAKRLGTSAILLRFLIGIFLGYPFACMYLLLLKNAKKNWKHLYFVVTGLLINYFCFGSDFLYNVFSILVTYVSLLLFGGTIQSVIFAFIFHTGYLTLGYIKNASDGYDVKWTTPQCILCLRLIGLAWNVYDGAQKKEKLSPDQLKTRVDYIPSILQVFAYSYCFCGFLSGPQYSFRLYLQFVDELLVEEQAKGKTSSRYFESFKRFFGACMALLTFTFLNPYFQCDDLLVPAFMEKSFPVKVLQMALVYYVQFSKYVIVWWFCESVCILIGLSYNGIDVHGYLKWDGLRNFKLRPFLFGAFFQDIIESFNINTNQWAGRYLFRRLRFLGNKSASHVLTLLYLAIWHGFYVGYFIMFFLEFIVVIAEREYCIVFGKLFKTTFNRLPLYTKIPVQVLGAFMKFIGCGFCAQAFLLLRWRRIKVVYAACYYWPVILLASWFLLMSPLIKRMMKRNKLDESVKKAE